MIWVGAFLRLKYLEYARNFFAQRYHRRDAPAKADSSWVVGAEADQPMRIGELLGAKLTLLVGVSSACTSCHQVAEALGNFLTKTSNAMQVIVVSNNERMRSRLPEGACRYLVDPEIEIAGLLGVSGTPFLAPIAHDGTFRFAPVDGKDAVIIKLKEIFSDLQAS